MPSIFHQSPGMAARGLSLIDQSIARQPNGLINVVVKYVAAAINVDQLLPQFTIDSAPPIHPDIIDRRELETERLYLQNFTAERSTGFVTINAQYCGALVRGSITPYQTNQFARGTVGMPIYALQENGQIGQGNEGFGFSRPLFDEYRFSYRSRIIRYEIATVNLTDFDLTIPAIVQKTNQEGLIIGWEILSTQFAGESSRNQYSYRPAYYKRNYTAAQWLDYIVASNDTLPRLQTIIETEIENVTPIVKVVRKRVSLFVPPKLLLL